MKKEGYFLISGIALLNIIIIILFAFNNPFNDVFYFFIRLFSLLGLGAMFVSSILTPFQKELYELYKKPFIKIHHSTTIAGLIMITLHPVVFAINVMVNSDFVSGLKVFIPDFSSAYNFWLLAGRPALILIYIAFIGVLLRKALKNGWRWIHSLNYFALVFGVVHGIMIGTDFYNFQDPIQWQKLIITILFLLMTITAIITFTIKRIRMYKLAKKRKERAMKKEMEKREAENQATEETELTEYE